MKMILVKVKRCFIIIYSKLNFVNVSKEKEKEKRRQIN